MTRRNIEAIFSPREPHWVGDGFRVHNFIPSFSQLSMERMNPFVLLDYNSSYEFPPSPEPRGVGVHPHRGFETVTISYKGMVEHHDSSGGGGVIGEGDVQWMTAAKGILHKEFHETNWSKRGGIFHVVQLWVNLPAANKMSEPKYQAIKKEDFGVFDLPNNSGKVEIIAGNYNNISGPASTFSPIHVMNLKLNAHAEVTCSFPKNYNTALLVIEGEINVNSKEHIPTDHFALFENNAEEFKILAKEKSVVLLLSGEPFSEPISAHGPFVMNTRSEILQAFDDFNQGKFGYLAD